MSVRIRVGKYELGRTLGEGVFAKVKYGRNRETGAAVAIKIIDKDYILKHSLTNQIKREISTMKRIKHPHVVHLSEVLASKKKVYIVMEYVNGGELFDKVVGVGRLGEDEARKYFQQLVQAVDYCHSRGVYHRDLKPENLLLDSDGNLKISDFGLSALSQQQSKDGLLYTICGTPNYVAPEVINEKGYDGAHADLWSCGVILYVLNAGFLPFEDSNLICLYKKIYQADFTIPSWFSEGAKTLVKRILDPNPKTRMTIPEILEDEWFKVGYNPVQYVETEKAVDDDFDQDAIVNDAEDALITEESRPVLMNAFELISMSQGLNLSGLFEEQEESVKTENRFTVNCPAKETISRIEDFANSHGFTVKKKNYKINIQSMKPGREGCLSVATEIFEMGPSLFMVEMKMTSGDDLEYKDFDKNLLSALDDIVWKTDDEAN